MSSDQLADLVEGLILDNEYGPQRLPMPPGGQAAWIRPLAERIAAAVKDAAYHFEQTAYLKGVRDGVKAAEQVAEESSGNPFTARGMAALDDDIQRERRRGLFQVEPPDLQPIGPPPAVAAYIAETERAVEEMQLAAVRRRSAAAWKDTVAHAQAAHATRLAELDDFQRGQQEQVADALSVAGYDQPPEPPADADPEPDRRPS